MMKDLDPAPSMDPAKFRRVLGHFCSGVTIVSAIVDGRPVGLTCQSFLSLSLDPPLIGFSPSKTSNSYAQIRGGDAFCINVLADDQRGLCDTFGRTRDDKWDGVDWRPGVTGSPIIDGALAWIDCRLESEQEVGDHYFTIGRVLALDGADRRPLLYFRSAYDRLHGAED